MRVEQECSQDIKDMFMLSFNNPILLGCIGITGLMLYSSINKEGMQLKLSSIVRSDLFDDGLKLCLYKFMKSRDKKRHFRLRFYQESLNKLYVIIYNCKKVIIIVDIFV